ncbi:hypothetical protein CFC21_096556 [Triticum aestivum]|uniref:Diphosphomevalonate decarboxylase n=3 Tax=Triticum TaxID=4564 RepID=A0A9R1BK44_TRITD|nr:hypothetical protein CFC21_096556 [Triticum aestivum]VAI71536.1 unnamed protein product [Triticum turgidum subsp. durum]
MQAQIKRVLPLSRALAAAHRQVQLYFSRADKFQCRQGSGSACRSIYGGFVKWCMGKNDDGSDSMAVQLVDESHWDDLVIIIAVVSSKQKETSSTSGMRDTIETSPLLQYRAQTVVPSRILKMEEAIKNCDSESFARLTCADSNQFHVVCLDTSPPMFYMNDTPHRPKLKEQVRYCDQHPEEIDTLVEVKAQFSEAKKCHKTSRRMVALSNAVVALTIGLARWMRQYLLWRWIDIDRRRRRLQAEIVNTDVNYVEIACRSAASGLEMRMPLHSVAPVARRGSFITQGTNAIGTTTLLQSAHAVLRGLEELVARHKILLTFSKIMLVSFIASHHQVIGAIEVTLPYYILEIFNNIGFLFYFILTQMCKRKDFIGVESLCESAGVPVRTKLYKMVEHYRQNNSSSYKSEREQQRGTSKFAMVLMWSSTGTQIATHEIGRYWEPLVCVLVITTFSIALVAYLM